jgi:hypothetical protein
VTARREIYYRKINKQKIEKTTGNQKKIKNKNAIKQAQKHPTNVQTKAKRLFSFV